MVDPAFHPGNDKTSRGVSAAQMKLVLDVSRMLAITTDLDALLDRIAQAACDLLHCERASIWLHDPATSELWTKVAIGSGEIRVPSSIGIVGAAFTSNHVLDVSRPYEDPRFDSANDRRSGFVTRSLLAAPMEDFGNKPVGVIQAINKITGSFTAEDLSLIQLLADQAGVVVQRHRLQAAALQAAEFKKEMDLARKVQEAMLPRMVPILPGFDAAGWAKPASVTGGDCYDFWTLPDGRLGIFLADASGHGVGPALVVSQTRTLIRALCDSCDNPHQLLSRINARLAMDLEPTRFVTAFLAFLSPDGTLQWQSAGHGPIFFRASSNVAVQCLDAPVPPLNALPDLLDESPAPMKLEPGGSLVVTSDGIFESFNPAGQLFSSDRVVALLDQVRDRSARDCIDCLHRAIHIWQSHDAPMDDQTIVAVRRNVP